MLNLVFKLIVGVLTTIGWCAAQMEKYDSYFSIQRSISIDLQSDLVSAYKIIEEFDCVFVCNKDLKCFSCAFTNSTALQTNCFLFANSSKQSILSTNSTIINLYNKLVLTTSSIVNTSSNPTSNTVTATTSPTTTTTTTTITLASPMEPDYLIFFNNATKQTDIVGYTSTNPLYPTFDAIKLGTNPIQYYFADRTKIYNFSLDWSSCQLIYEHPNEVLSIVIVNQDVYVAMFDRLLKTTANFTTQVQVMRNSTNEEFFRIHYDRLNDQILVSIFATTGNSSVRIYDRNLAWIDTLPTDSTERLAIFAFNNVIYTADSMGMVKLWKNKTLINSYPACISIAISISVDNNGMTMVACRNPKTIMLFNSLGNFTGKQFLMADDPSLAKFDRNGSLIVTTTVGKMYRYQ